MIRSAVPMSADPARSRSVDLLEQLHSGEWLGRPRSEAIKRELCLLSRIDVYKDIIVLLFWRLTLPIKIRRIVRRQLDARSAREDGILFRAAAAQHQVFHPVDVVHLGRVDMAIEHNHLHVLGVRRDHLVWIIGFGDRSQPRPSKYRVVEDDESLADSLSLGF